MAHLASPSARLTLHTWSCLLVFYLLAPPPLHLNVDLAVITPESQVAVTEVASDSVHTGSIVLARVRQAVVHICLAPTSGESCRAGAVVVSNPIEAGSSVQTRLVPALVPVRLAVVPGVPVLAEAPGVILSRTRSPIKGRKEERKYIYKVFTSYRFHSRKRAF